MTYSFLKAAADLFMKIFWIVLLILYHYKMQKNSLEDTTDKTISESKNDSAVTISTKCFKKFGCFSNGPPFYDPDFRKDSVLPEEQLNTKYLLFTPSTPGASYNMSLNIESVALSPFNASLETKVLIPGFMTNLKADGDLTLMKDEILKAVDVNVIIIDWSCSNDFPYNQAVANGRLVGAQASYLLQLIKRNKNIDYKSVHIIGHSLGAHVAGWAGERLNKIGRITGLDPAGPLFQHAPPPVRLDPSDADFVDVIHTDAANKLSEGFGLLQSIGHLDFYPNNGYHQPACGSKSHHFIILNVDTDVCQHLISKDYFISSINKCVFLAVHCKSYEKFVKKECTKENSLTAEMGFHAKKIENVTGLPTFYLNTTAKPPYCANSNTKPGSR